MSIHALPTEASRMDYALSLNRGETRLSSSLSRQASVQATQLSAPSFPFHHAGVNVPSIIKKVLLGVVAGGLLISSSSNWVASAHADALISSAIAQSAPPPPPPASTNSASEQVRRQQEQPGNNAPVWRAVRSEESHFTGVLGRETGVFMQSGGETWRERRNNQLIPLGGFIFVTMLLACVLFYSWRGTMPLETPETGRRIQRFSLFERTVHWTVAISFSILAISGLVMAFGKWVILPVIGNILFSFLAGILKNLHNFAGPVFGIALIPMFFMFVKRNLPQASDWEWIRKGGGLFSKQHISSGFFNAGEKIWFWLGVFCLGILAVISGLVLDFPNFDQTRATMQLAHTVHLPATVLMMSMALGHIYMGTLGVAGAFEAMKTGEVDEAWAKEHHEHWFQEMKSAGKLSSAPAPQSMKPAS